MNRAPTLTKPRAGRDEGWKQKQNGGEIPMAEGSVGLVSSLGPGRGSFVPAVGMRPPVSRMRDTKERRRVCSKAEDRP